jgi:lipopolysaccharide/colanic/teichoic acid biosynthesis glycosyltransferase
LIKLEDGGKVFFIQERVKEGEDTFNIIKFRSMKETKDDEVLPATKDDDRITKVGRFIRNWRIDEIPQLINVLKGDMSIVGPRPERKEHVEIYSRDIPEFKYRLRVKAGLTGLAQVYGKYNTTAYDKLKLDLIYIQNFSLILDLKIILRTIQILFKKESAEGFTEEDSK